MFREVSSVQGSGIAVYYIQSCIVHPYIQGQATLSIGISIALRSLYTYFGLRLVL